MKQLHRDLLRAVKAYRRNIVSASDRHLRMCDEAEIWLRGFYQQYLNNPTVFTIIIRMDTNGNWYASLCYDNEHNVLVRITL